MIVKTGEDGLPIFKKYLKTKFVALKLTIPVKNV